MPAHQNYAYHLIIGSTQAEVSKLDLGPVNFELEFPHRPGLPLQFHCQLASTQHLPILLKLKRHGYLFTAIIGNPTAGGVEKAKFRFESVECTLTDLAISSGDEDEHVSFVFESAATESAEFQYIDTDQTGEVGEPTSFDWNKSVP